MNIGDIRMELPTVDSELMLADRQKRKCEVIYIHPEYRFYVVEFITERGWKFRETFYFRDRDPSGPELPEHIRQQRERRKREHRRAWHSKPKIGVMYQPVYST